MPRQHDENGRNTEKVIRHSISAGSLRFLPERLGGHGKSSRPIVNSNSRQDLRKANTPQHRQANGQRAFPKWRKSK